ncbi:penicillin-binding protein 2 [Butyrivibrio sp. INlla16]|uniref:peptidoglycan D,D-transpeptidase FtsI family protein n=1 Tax=Butyrivibrio sp. INlla16 TaxID=1520807 RepID=UPI0008805C77|nr:penicillin-binding transpeptidase domain-containing protein [Butyrivibrio sp. INlla16]SDB16718.1 peptidoglycan glycosyltransferase [Butyrivibrio sp. INlla16]
MQEKNKSYPIIIIGVFTVILFISMISYISIYAITNHREMMDNSYNAHQQLLKKQNTRGTIYSADGQALAITSTDEEGNETREYPFGKTFSHVVGFSVNGRSGIEDLANYYLINSNAALKSKAEAKENDKKFPGDDVYTTLDVDLQQTAYEALSARDGAIIVTEVKTGKVLALVSKPDFDPATILKDWDSITNDKSNTQLLNRATQGLYPPGSTFKIVTSLEYYREIGEDYKNYKFNCNGKFASGDDVIRCFHGENHGSLDFPLSFAKSCNSSFANISLQLNRDAFGKTLDKLMFNNELPWDMNYSVSSAVCDNDLGDADTMQLGIGQGKTLVTPLHMNLITAAIANNGTLMKPYLIDSVVSADGKKIETFSPKAYKTLVSEEESDFLKEMMLGVVKKGTASKLKGLSYNAAGKTGSAEFKDSASDSHAWFTGFAPYEDPEIAVTIIVENAGSGGEFAVPIAKRLFDCCFNEK